MVRFRVKIPKTNIIYKEIEKAVDTFKKESTGEFVVFGTLMLESQEFAGVVLSTTASKKISDALDEALAEVPAAPPPPMMSDMAKAAGLTYAAMIAAGWTDALMLEHGYLEDDVPF